MFSQSLSGYAFAPLQTRNAQRHNDGLTTLLGNAQYQLYTATFPTIAHPPRLETLAGFFSAAASAFPLYVMVFNAIAAVAPGATPRISIPLSAINQAFSYSIVTDFLSGIRVAVSTTPATLTTALAGDVLRMEATYYEE